MGTSIKQRHMEMLKSGLESMKDDTDLADVEICVNQTSFKCHRAILAAVSPYFRAMFTGGMKESREKRITLQDIDEVAFDKFLNFIYTGKDENIGEDVAEVLRIAALYQVDCLQDHCEELLIERLRADNCIELFRLACMFNCKTLRKRSWPAILDGFCSVWKTDQFDSLTLEEIINIIKDDNLVTLDEEHVCEAVIKWVNADYQKRKSKVYQIFKYVRLPHVTPEFLVNTLYKTKCLTESAECRRLLEEAQHFHLLPARRLDYSNSRMRYRADDDLEEVLLVVTENDDERGSFYEGSWCLWAFSFHQRRWFTLAPIPISDSPGRDFAVCAHGYDIYLTGGTNNPKALLKFESERNEWVLSSGQLKKGRCQHCMVSIGNSLYCIGGNNLKLLKSSRVIGTIEEYYIPGQRWRTVGDLEYPVHSTAAAVCGEQIFVFGGIGKGDSHLSYVQCFHSRLKESSVISNLPFSSTRLITTTIGETVFITYIGKDGNGVVKLSDDFGFTDLKFDVTTDRNLLGATHHNGQFIYLEESEHVAGHLGNIIKVNMTTSKAEVLIVKGNACPKPVHACQRTYVDKRFLYHTYYQ